MKPNPKVPQLWVSDHADGTSVRILYPNGYVESNTPNLDWDESFFTNADYGVALLDLISYNHKFLFNIE